MGNEHVPESKDALTPRPGLIPPPEPLIEKPGNGTPDEAQSPGQDPVDTKGADIGEASEFLWNTHQYLNEYIRFSDAKAGVVIVFASGIIAAMYSVQLHVAVFSAWPAGWRWLEWAAAAGFALLAAAVILSVWAIRPRLTNSQRQGFIFWDSIRGFSSAADFRRALLTQNSTGMAEHLAEHLFTLAGVSHRKYFCVSLSIWAALLGATAGAAAIVLKDLP
jgi:uncharacterized integral membrane protein